jgi:hypothetical protein
MNTAQSAVLRRLAEAGTWLSRAELAHGLKWSEQRVDDELADLVATGTALFNGRGNEYRLGGTALARSAMQRLLKTGAPRVLLARPAKDADVMHVGVATRARCFDGGELLVMGDLELPYARRDPQACQQMADALARMARMDLPA